MYLQAESFSQKINSMILIITALFTTVCRFNQAKCSATQVVNTDKFLMFCQIPSFHLLRFAKQWSNLKANPRLLLELYNQQQR